jgi:hypothetical protein
MQDEDASIEHVEDEIKEAGYLDHKPLHQWALLLTAIFAVLAAISSLHAGRSANEAMIGQIKSSDGWAHYQAKSIKGTVVENEIALLKADSDQHHDTSSLQARADRYEAEQASIATDAKAYAHLSEHELERHEQFATATSFFQIAIALIAIALLTRARFFMVISALTGLVGGYFLARGFGVVPDIWGDILHHLPGASELTETHPPTP